MHKLWDYQAILPWPFEQASWNWRCELQGIRHNGLATFYRRSFNQPGARVVGRQIWGVETRSNETLQLHRVS